MTTIGMQYEVIPGKEEEFEKGILATLDYLKTLPGHVESRLFEDVASTGSYLIMSQWSSRTAFDDVMKSDAFRKAVAWGRAEILRSRPKHQIYDHM